MIKKPTIKFSYQPTPTIHNARDGKHYFCSQVTDSLDFTPGEYYTKEDVQALCDSRNWKVTVVAPHME